MTVDPTSKGRASAGRPLVIVAVVWLLAIFHLAGSVIDDTYITLRFARNLAEGHGLVFNPGVRVEGYTNFLWVLFAAGTVRLGLPPLLVLPAVAFLAGAAVLVLTFRTARALAVVRGPGTGVAATFIVAMASGYAMYVNAGMETLVFAAFASAAGVAAVFRRPVAFGVCTSLAFLTRPEAALLGIVGFGLFALRPVTARRRWGDLVRAASPIALLVGPYLAWKAWYFGSLLPNTLAAKQPDVVAGCRYVTDALVPAGGIVVAAIVGAVRKPASRQRELLMLFAVCTAGVALEGGDWMPAHRLMVPWLPWLAMAADEALTQTLVAGVRAVTWRARAIALAAGASLLVWAGVNASDVMFLHGYYSGLESMDAALSGFALQARFAGVHRVALFDIGRVGYIASGIEIVDLAGLTDPVIARAPGRYGDKHIPTAYLAQRNPDLVVTDSFFPVRRHTPGGPLQVLPQWPVEQYLLGTRWLADNYAYACTVNTGRMYFHVFARRTGVPALGPGPCVRRAPEVF